MPKIKKIKGGITVEVRPSKDVEIYDTEFSGDNFVYIYAKQWPQVVKFVREALKGLKEEEEA